MRISAKHRAPLRARVLAAVPRHATPAARRSHLTHATTDAAVGLVTGPLGTEAADGVLIAPVAVDVEATNAITSASAALADATPVGVATGIDADALHAAADADVARPRTTGLLRDLTGLFASRNKAQDRPFMPPLDGFVEMVLGGNPKDYTSECVKDFVGPHDGPIRLLTPTVPRPPGSPDPATLPLLFYLPGIDGTGLAAYRQFPPLAQAFDLRCVVYPPGDRTPFEELTNVVADLVAAEVAAVAEGRPVYLLGESFGGLLCLSVAASPAGRETVDRVVLVNPATSFARSPWPVLGSALPAMPPPLYSVLPFVLSPMLTSPFGIAMHYVQQGDPLPDQVSDFAHGLVGLVPELGNLRQVLPPETLAWRLRLLQQGCQAMEDRYKQVQQRVLVLAGERDLLIPSSTEAPALAQRLPRARHMILEGRSHALLQEAGVELVTILQEQGFYVRETVLSVDLPPPRNLLASTSTPTSTASSSSTSDESSGRSSSSSSATSTSTARGTTGSGAAFGTPRPVPLPTITELDKAVADAGITTLRRIVSPVFFSTEASGRVVQGLGAVPTGRPLLFVGNHQLFAPDMPLMIEQFIREKQMLLRGLAHPGTLEGVVRDPQEGARSGPGSRSAGDFLKTFGAVPVNGRNMFLLLQQGEAALLYPGGVREALKNKGEKYQLIWPERAEFVRMAARFGATIVPFGAVGAEDSVNMLLDQQEVMGLPVVGEWVRQQQAGARQARTGVSASDSNVDVFVPPLVSLNPPDRFYYRFQRPIPTSPDMASDKVACEALYAQVKGDVAGAIDYLLLQREQDPFRALLPRLVYEASWGGNRQAPSFTP